jgi:hypothetical protein
MAERDASVRANERVPYWIVEQMGHGFLRLQTPYEVGCAGAAVRRIRTPSRPIRRALEMMTVLDEAECERAWVGRDPAYDGRFPAANRS